MTRVVGLRRFWHTLLPLLLCGLPSGVAAQTMCPHSEMAPSHWVIDELHSLEALGSPNDSGWTRTLSGCTAMSALRLAVADSALTAGQRMRAGNLADRLEREFSTSVRAGPVSLIGTWTELGAGWRNGETAPGFGEFPPERTGAVALDDAIFPAASVGGHLIMGPRLDASVRVGLGNEGLDLNQAQVTTRFGLLNISVGRGWTGMGYAPGGSLILTGSVPFDRVAIAAPALPVDRLLWDSSKLGFSTYAGRLDKVRHSDNPIFWGASLRFQPIDRIDLRVHRAALFGGDEAITAGRLIGLLIGRVNSAGFEDQIVSAEGVFRLPTEGWQPATFYMEWGAEDAAGAWWDVPGIVAGILMPGFVGLETWDVGFEFATLSPSCCDNPEWYRHFSFPGSWVAGSNPLGYPLGGNGGQSLVRVRMRGPMERLLGEIRFARRNYGDENLYVPGRSGKSHGMTMDWNWRWRGSTEVRGVADVERGEGWTRSTGELTLKVFY